MQGWKISRDGVLWTTVHHQGKSCLQAKITTRTFITGPRTVRVAGPRLILTVLPAQDSIGLNARRVCRRVGLGQRTLIFCKGGCDSVSLWVCSMCVLMSPTHALLSQQNGKSFANNHLPIVGFSLPGPGR